MLTPSSTLSTHVAAVGLDVLPVGLRFLTGFRRPRRCGRENVFHRVTSLDIDVGSHVVSQLKGARRGRLFAFVGRPWC